VNLLEAIFWVSAGIVVFSTVGYPCILLAVAPRGRPPASTRPLPDDELPSVAVLVAAHNEERHIAERVRNLLALDYPPDRLHFYIGSDGSTDRTIAELRQVPHERVHVHDFPQRRGKASVINDLVELSSQDVLVFTDANTSFDRDTLRHLVQPLASPDVGCVCGELRLIDSAGDNQDHIYWRFERMLKYHESRLGALLGANGGVYAMHRTLYRAIPANTIVDDFWISMQAVEAGRRCLYAREALAYEAVPDRISDEFKRRVRIGMGNYQALRRFSGLLHPRHGRVAFAFLSHKVTRWLAPHAMLLALATSCFLIDQPLYAYLCGVQLAFYGIAGSGWVYSRFGIIPRLFRMPLFFVSMNVALLLGWWQYVRGRSTGIWVRTAR